MFLTTWIVWIIILTQVCVLTGCAAGTGSESGSVSEKENTREESMEREGEDILQVQALKVGKADAIVLFCGGETMVIDCGEEEDGQEVLAYLQAEGVSEIDVLMITHFDKDHVGGADTVMNGISVSRVLLPAYTGSGTGLRGTTSVKVVVKNKKVQSITVTSYEDDQQYFEAAKSTVINNIIKAQSLDVDGVSGATFSSNSIKEAVAKALSITYTNPNSSMLDGGEHHHGFH